MHPLRPIGRGVRSLVCRAAFDARDHFRLCRATGTGPDLKRAWSLPGFVDEPSTAGTKGITDVVRKK